MNLKQIIEAFDEKFDERKTFLNESRYYFNEIFSDEIKQFISTQITQLLEELREEESNEYEITGKNCSDLIYADMGHNELARKINSKIDKILNNK